MQAYCFPTCGGCECVCIHGHVHLTSNNINSWSACVQVLSSFSYPLFHDNRLCQTANRTKKIGVAYTPQNVLGYEVLYTSYMVRYVWPVQLHNAIKTAFVDRVEKVLGRPCICYPHGTPTHGYQRCKKRNCHCNHSHKDLKQYINMHKTHHFWG